MRHRGVAIAARVVGLLLSHGHAAKAETDTKHDSCQDFAGWNDTAYTPAEGDLSCAGICGVRACNMSTYKSGQVQWKKKQKTTVYIAGNIGMFYKVENMLRSPYKATIEDRMNFVTDKVGRSGAELPMVGTFWFPADAAPVSSLLRDGGMMEHIPDEAKSLFTSIQTTDAPTDDFKKACDLAGVILGSTSFIVDEVNTRCSKVPDNVKSATDDQLSDSGKKAKQLWTGICGSKVDQPNRTFTCFASSAQSSLIDANRRLSDGLITPKFNLPWEVACCCCGGGTSKNPAGTQMTFVIEKHLQNISRKLLETTESVPTNISKAADVLPKYATNQDLVRQAYTQGLPYKLPDQTFPQEAYAKYPYEGGAECEDYRLDEHIESTSLQFADYPSDWVDWYALSCRYYHYSKLCHDGEAEAQDKAPFPTYFNGLFKQSVVDAWNLTNIAEGHRTADAFKVCCACGGGLKKNNTAPKHVQNPFDPNYYMR